MSRVTLALFALVSCFAQQPAANDGGIIAGNVSGEDGSSVTRAYVTLHLSFTAGSAGRQRFQTQWGVYSGSDGSFRFTGLRNGTYRLCVQAPGTAWLDPCEWGLGIPIVTLPGANSSATVRVILKQGAEVPIRIDDPGRFLLQNASKGAGSRLLVGVRTPAFTFRPAVLAAQEETGRTLKVVIPFDKPVNVAIASSFFKLAESNGTPFSKPGISIPLTVPAGQKAATVRISVTGGK